MGEKEIMVHLAEARSRGLDAFTAAGYAADLAAQLHLAAQADTRPDEQALADALHALVADPQTRHFCTELCRHVFLSAAPAEQRATLRRLAARQAEIPAIFPRAAQWVLKAAAMLPAGLHRRGLAPARQAFHSVFGGLYMPTHIRKLGVRIHRYAQDGLAVALDPLIPAVHGKKSAERYMQHLVSVLQRQDGGGVVIQPWRLCPGLSPYAPTDSIKELAYKLHKLIGLSLAKGRIRPVVVQGGLSPTINLVAEALTYALRGQDLNRADVAIEMPAYLKNTPAVLRGLVNWAGQRAALGGAPLKVLLVKGSHLDEEDECTCRHGGANPVYGTKAGTDARFRHLLHALFTAPPRAVTPVVGTHSIFDIAFALEDWAGCGRSGLPEFCMTAGLADPVARLLHRLGARVVLCCGVTNGQAGTERRLLRLLHELGRPGNAVSAQYGLDPKSPEWDALRQDFLGTLEFPPDPEYTPPQDRFVPTPRARILDRKRMTALLHAGEREFSRWQRGLPVLDDGFEGSGDMPCEHRSIFNSERIDYRYNAMDADTLDRMVRAALMAARTPAPPAEERQEQIMLLAEELEKKESMVIGTLMRESGMTLEEAEQELLMAIDSCRLALHPRTMAGLGDGTRPAGGNVVAVLPGHTHPLADAVSGIMAAWMTDSAVIYRPPAQSAMLGTRIAELLKRMGFESPRLLTLICTDETAAILAADPRVYTVITAGHRRRHAASSGSASLYLSANCDWETAVRDIAASSFRHAGQEQELPHIILVHAGLYDNQGFRNALQDAVRTLPCGPGWVEGTRVGLLSRPLTEEQQLLLTAMDGEESWLVQPHSAGKATLLWSPGVRTGIRPEGFFTHTAQDVPAIGLVRVEDTAAAIRLQQQLSGGMYAGIYSGDGEEIEAWCRAVPARNRDINCISTPCPGALPAAHALPGAPMRGGHNFTAAVCPWSQAEPPGEYSARPDLPFRPWEELVPPPSPAQTDVLVRAAGSVTYWWQEEFGTEHVLRESALYRTVLQYAPLRLALRAEPMLSDLDLSTILMAALRAGCSVRLSTPGMRPWMHGALSAQPGVELVQESRQEFEQQFPHLAAEGYSVRFPGAPMSTCNAAAACGLEINTRPALANGRLELLNCMAEHVTTRRSAAPSSLT